MTSNTKAIVNKGVSSRGTGKVLYVCNHFQLKFPNVTVIMSNIVGMDRGCDITQGGSGGRVSCMCGYYTLYAL